uniref:Uncharacterized protein n=1 Tax=Arundo donax TaxID=35708 RepID=A0A0A9B3J5_ARUDO
MVYLDFWIQQHL